MHRLVGEPAQVRARRLRLRRRRALARAHRRRRRRSPRATTSAWRRSTRTDLQLVVGSAARTRHPKGARSSTALIVARRRRPHPPRVPVRGGQGRARVRARRHLPPRPAAARAEGPGPLPPDPGHRPDGQGRPADDHAERAAAGGDHEGQRARCGSTRSPTSGSSSRRPRSSRSRTSWSRPRRSRRRRCAPCSASTCSTSCSPSATRSTRSCRTIIDEATSPWGVKVSIVEVKDVEIPASMQRAMARQAEAERERRAKVIAAEGEFQASERLTDAADVMAQLADGAPAALPADAARDRRDELDDDRLPCADRPAHGVHGQARRQGTKAEDGSS